MSKSNVPEVITLMSSDDESPAQNETKILEQDRIVKVEETAKPILGARKSIRNGINKVETGIRASFKPVSTFSKSITYAKSTSNNTAFLNQNNSFSISNNKKHKNLEIIEIEKSTSSRSSSKSTTVLNPNNLAINSTNCKNSTDDGFSKSAHSRSTVSKKDAVVAPISSSSNSINNENKKSTNNELKTFSVPKTSTISGFSSSSVSETNDKNKKSFENEIKKSVLNVTTSFPIIGDSKSDSLVNLHRKNTDKTNFIEKSSFSDYKNLKNCESKLKQTARKSINNSYQKPVTSSNTASMVCNVSEKPEPSSFDSSNTPSKLLKMDDFFTNVSNLPTNTDKSFQPDSKSDIIIIDDFIDESRVNKSLGASDKGIDSKSCSQFNKNNVTISEQIPKKRNKAPSSLKQMIDMLNKETTLNYKNKLPSEKTDIREIKKRKMDVNKSCKLTNQSNKTISESKKARADLGVITVSSDGIAYINKPATQSAEITVTSGDTVTPKKITLLNNIVKPHTSRDDTSKLNGDKSIDSQNSGVKLKELLIKLDSLENTSMKSNLKTLETSPLKEMPSSVLSSTSQGILNGQSKKNCITPKQVTSPKLSLKRKREEDSCESQKTLKRGLFTGSLDQRISFPISNGDKHQEAELESITSPPPATICPAVPESISKPSTTTSALCQSTDSKSNDDDLFAQKLLQPSAAKDYLPGPSVEAITFKSNRIKFEMLLELCIFKLTSVAEHKQKGSGVKKRIKKEDVESDWKPEEGKKLSKVMLDAFNHADKSFTSTLFFSNFIDSTWEKLKINPKKISSSLYELKKELIAYKARPVSNHNDISSSRSTSPSLISASTESMSTEKISEFEKVSSPAPPSGCETQPCKNSGFSAVPGSVEKNCATLNNPSSEILIVKSDEITEFCSSKQPNSVSTTKIPNLTVNNIKVTSAPKTSFSSLSNDDALISSNTEALSAGKISEFEKISSPPPPPDCKAQSCKKSEFLAFSGLVEKKHASPKSILSEQLTINSNETTEFCSAKHSSSVSTTEIPNLTGNNIKLSSSKINRNSASANEEAKAKVEQNIKKLEKYLCELGAKIKKLQEEEVDLDDEDSAFVQEERYTKKYWKVWTYLCKLKKRSPTKHLGSQLEKRFCYSGTRYPEINKAVEANINRRRKNEKVPDYLEMYNLVKSVNEEKRIGLMENDCSYQAKVIFQDVVRELKRRRWKDYEMDFGNSVIDDLNIEEDPAEKDKELENKLKCNAIESKRKIDEIIDKYVEMEEPEENEDSDEKLEPEYIEEECQLPDTEPATPPSESSDVDSKRGVQKEAPTKECAVIDIVSDSDASTDPGFDVLISEKKTPEKETYPPSLNPVSLMDPPPVESDSSLELPSL